VICHSHPGTLIADEWLTTIVVTPPAGSAGVPSGWALASAAQQVTAQQVTGVFGWGGFYWTFEEPYGPAALTFDYSSQEALDAAHTALSDAISMGLITDLGYPCNSYVAMVSMSDTAVMSRTQETVWGCDAVSRVAQDVAKYCLRNSATTCQAVNLPSLCCVAPPSPPPQAPLSEHVPRL
jgi:hypothetical protein